MLIISSFQRKNHMQQRWQGDVVKKEKLDTTRRYLPFLLYSESGYPSFWPMVVNGGL